MCLDQGFELSVLALSLWFGHSCSHIAFANTVNKFYVAEEIAVTNLFCQAWFI